MPTAATLIQPIATAPGAYRGLPPNIEDELEKLTLTLANVIKQLNIIISENS